MDVQTVKPQLDIDTTACRADEGLKSVFEAIRENAQEGMQALRDFASRITEDGDYIRENFHTSSNAVADLERSRAIKSYDQLQMIFIPSQPPEIHYTPGSVDINITPDKLNIDWEVSPKAEVNVTQKPAVDISLVQKPSIHFEYIPPQSLNVTA